jgi:hypothetical protein
MQIIKDDYIRHNDDTSLSFITKLYIWSVAIEPLLFFSLLHPSVLGFNLSVSRLLQLVVVFFVIMKFPFVLKKRPIRIGQYYNFTSYFIYIFLVGFCAAIFSYYQFFIINPFEGGGIFQLISKRQIIEYLVVLYAFIYFVFLAVYFVRTKYALKYFINTMLIVFFVTVVVGYIDLFFVYFFEIELILIHIYTDTDPGSRFHSIAGEPRDAFVYLVFGISLMYMKFAIESVIVKKYQLVIILFALLFTLSFSGLVGIILALMLYISYGLGFFYGKINKKIISFSIFSLFILSSIYYLIYINVSELGDSSYFNRIISYASYIYQIILDGFNGKISKLPADLKGQSPNIYPLLGRLEELLNLNFLPTIFGTGLGSSSNVNISFLGSAFTDVNVNNPHSELIRQFYDGGIVGLVLYLLVFLSPSRKLALLINNRSVIFSMILVLGVSLGHRSYLVYIFLGLVFVYSEIIYRDSKLVPRL